MSVIKKYSETSLVLRIVIGLIIGLVLALVFPKAQWISMFGTIFVGALKAVAPVLVFCVNPGRRWENSSLRLFSSI